MKVTYGQLVLTSRNTKKHLTKDTTELYINAFIQSTMWERQILMVEVGLSLIYVPYGNPKPFPIIVMPYPLIPLGIMTESKTSQLHPGETPRSTKTKSIAPSFISYRAEAMMYAVGTVNALPSK